MLLREFFSEYKKAMHGINSDSPKLLREKKLLRQLQHLVDGTHCLLCDGRVDDDFGALGEEGMM